MDIKFDTDTFRFNVRSSCIVKDLKHKYVVLTNMKAIRSHEAFILPGGRIEIMESSDKAVAREIGEELGIKANYKLVGIQENYNIPINFHMVEFVYYAETDDILGRDFNPKDNWEKFKLIEIDKIDEYDIRPYPVKDLIKMENYNNVYHSINYDWANEIS